MASRSSNLCRKVKTLSSGVRVRFLSVSPHPSVSDSEESPIDSRFLRHSPPESKYHDHSSILLFPETRITTLPSGIRVVTQASPSSAKQTASVGVWIDSGSRFEAAGTNGTAHFLEHMIFKGTRRRTARSLEEEIENMGARLNAYTSREQTTFYADVRRTDVPAALDVLSDILQNSTFPDHAIRRERGVILREMEEVEGQIEEVIFDHLHMAAFSGHPLGDTILGPEDKIRTISKKDLHNYISTHYTGPRMVISAAGAVEHGLIVGHVDRLFTKFLPDPSSAAKLVADNPAKFTGSEVRVENTDMPLVHLAIAFPGASWTDPSSIPLMVMQSLLGTWNRCTGVGNCSGSQLARRVSADCLAESFMAFNTNYTDTGLFGVYASAEPECVRDLSQTIMEEIRRFANDVSEEEVMRARNQLKSALLLNIDGATAVAENNGRQLLTYGRVIHFLELFARIDAVDSAAVKETANKFLVDKDIAISAVGSIHQLPEYKWFRSQTCPQTKVKI